MNTHEYPGHKGLYTKMNETTFSTLTKLQRSLLCDPLFFISSSRARAGTETPKDIFNLSPSTLHVFEASTPVGMLIGSH